MNDCLFCRMVSGEIPCDTIYADDDVIAIRDINPQAPVHVLLIPRRHIASTAELTTGDAGLMGALCLAATNVAAAEGLAEKGYRWVVNCGREACQTVPHIHLHLLGGRELGWPPG